MEFVESTATAVVDTAVTQRLAYWQQFLSIRVLNLELKSADRNGRSDEQ